VGEFGLPDQSSGQFNTNLVAAGTLPFAWDDPSGAGVTAADGMVNFTVELRAVSNVCSTSDMLITGSPTAVEVTVSAVLADFRSENGQVTFAKDCDARVLPGGSDPSTRTTEVRPV